MTGSEYWMVWPANTAVSVLFVLLVAMAFLYAARKPVHHLIGSLGFLISGPLRIGARWLLAAANDMTQRNKAVLLAHGRQEVGQRIEREFERLGAMVTRDLQGYPALQRKLLDEITRVEEDYKKCGEVPPPPPDWVEAVTAIAKVKSDSNEMVQRILEEIKRSVHAIHDKALGEYRRAYESRHKILNGFMPFWRSLDKTFGQVDQKLTGLQQTSSKIDAQMEKYEQINKKTDKAEHALTVSAFTQFAISTMVLLIAVGGPLVNFRMIPTTAQMLLGFFLPFALAFVAVPLESFVYSLRTVGGAFLVMLIRATAFVLRVLGYLIRQLCRVLIAVYDVTIVLPLLVERLVNAASSAGGAAEARPL